jgi:hypothetical protein
MLSGLQIQNHRFVEFHLKPESSLTEEELKQRPMTCRHQLKWRTKDNDPLYWYARLRVEVLHPPEGSKSLYTGAFEVIGEFRVHPDVPETEREKLVALNSGAILYSSVREWVATLSARSLHGMVELPTLDARCFLPPPPAATQAKPTT